MSFELCIQNNGEKHVYQPFWKALTKLCSVHQLENQNTHTQTAQFEQFKFHYIILWAIAHSIYLPIYNTYIRRTPNIKYAHSRLRLY